MADLKCPHCGRYFTVDDTELSSIIKQIRDSEFEKDLSERLEELTRNMEEKHELELKGIENEVLLKAREAREKDKEELLKTREEHEKEKEVLKEDLQRERETVQRLKQKIDAGETEKKLAVMEAVKRSEDEKRDIEHKLAAQKDRYELLLDEKEKEVQLYKDMNTRMSTKMVGEALEQHCET